ncbi:MAG: AEC family transporter [Dysgonamonadaceae bacterium]|jgi:predicted permease|nr:AEC family transporter [Dysgonamonadaceae bacterium]
MLTDFYAGLAIVIILIFIGFFLSKIKIIRDESVKFLSNLILTVTLPIAFFNSFPDEFNFADLRLFLWGLISCIIILSLLILLSQVLFSKKIVKNNNYEYKFAFAFNNTSFIGYPLVSMAFGQDGLIAYAGFMLPWVIALFTYGIWLFNDNYTWKDTLKGFINPNVVGIILGAVFFIFGIRLPSIINQTVGMIAGLTTPLALLCIGFMLSEAKLKVLFKRWQVVFVCLTQLTIPPIFTWALLRMLGAPSVVISVLVLMQALPTAATLGLFNKKYKNTESEAGEIVTLSTLLAGITVPILIYFLISNK